MKDDLCYGELSQFTYDSMWCEREDLRVEVPDIRVNGSHMHSKFRTPTPTPQMEYTKMTDPTDIPNIFTSQTADELKAKAQETAEDFRVKAQETAQQAREALQNPTDPTVAQAVNTFKANQALIVTVVGAAVLWKLNKRAIRKVVSKEILTALSTTPVRMDVAAYFEDVDAFYAAKDAARAAAAWAHTTAVK